MKLLFCIGFCVAISSLLFLLVYGYSSGTRLKVFEVNENEIGVALLIFFPGVLWLSCKDRVRFFSPSNLLAFFYLMTAILITVLSGSRGSVLSFGVTILAFILWNTTRKWAKICVWVLLLSLLFAPFLFKTSFERFGELSSPKPLGPREDLWAGCAQGRSPTWGLRVYPGR